MVIEAGLAVADPMAGFVFARWTYTPMMWVPAD
jgi:hypothetical protein